MTEERINGIGITNINKKEKLGKNEVIQQVSKNSLKRLQLSDWTK